MSDDNSPVEEKKKGRGRPSATKKDVVVEEKKVNVTPPLANLQWMYVFMILKPTSYVIAGISFQEARTCSRWEERGEGTLPRQARTRKAQGLRKEGSQGKGKGMHTTGLFY